MALLYGAFAALWIACSDSILMGLSSDKHLILELSVLKGWLFVVVSGGLLYVILNRQFKRLDREVGELSRTRAEALANERRFSSLFENMPNGVARCRIVYEGGIPVDFIYLTVNRAFVRLTGLRDVEGKRVSEVIPGLLESDPRTARALCKDCGHWGADVLRDVCFDPRAMVFRLYVPAGAGRIRFRL